jgi:hypothetical protein
MQGDFRQGFLAQSSSGSFGKRQGEWSLLTFVERVRPSSLFPESIVMSGSFLFKSLRSKEWHRTTPCNLTHTGVCKGKRLMGLTPKEFSFSSLCQS